jgi:hypothetical protein
MDWALLQKPVPVTQWGSCRRGASREHPGDLIGAAGVSLHVDYIDASRKLHTTTEYGQ